LQIINNSTYLIELLRKMLHFNPLAIKTVQEKWKNSYPSKLEMFSALSSALKYDLMVKNPYDLIIANSKNVLFADNVCKTKRVAAAAIVALSIFYSAIMYGAFVYSFASSLRTVAVFTNFKKLEMVADSVRELGSRVINFGVSPVQHVFYNVPKGILIGIPLFISSSVNKAATVYKAIFDSFLTPIFGIIKKVVAWNRLQLIMAVRVVFDYTYDVFNWTKSNVFNPFWKLRVEPKIALAKEALEGYVVFAG